MPGIINFLTRRTFKIEILAKITNGSNHIFTQKRNITDVSLGSAYTSELCENQRIFVGSNCQMYPNVDMI